MKFTLSTPGQIRGDQLADEIYQATGVNLGSGIQANIAFDPPDTVIIPDSLAIGHETEIQTVISAHLPDPLYLPEDVERADGQARWQELRGLYQDEIGYLQAVIITIDTMTLSQIRSVVKRLAQENLRILQAFKHLFLRS